MSVRSAISWTDATWNPWIGCTKVSPGCANCYAEREDKFRSWTPDGWGRGKPRKRTSAAYWKQPLKWNAEAGDLTASGSPTSRKKVFCASLADWLDDEVQIDWLVDLLALIQATPNLDWLLLTKRPENFTTRTLMAGMFAMGYRDGQTSDLPSAPQSHSDEFIEWVLGWSKGERMPNNVWVGVSVEDQIRADERMPELVEINARVKFVSVEPLLGSVDLSYWIAEPIVPQVHWVIVGGESGPNARPMDPEWVRMIRDECMFARVPFHFKQWGGVNKKAAGRLLDGCEYNEFPVVKQIDGGIS